MERDRGVGGGREEKGETFLHSKIVLITYAFYFDHLVYGIGGI